MNERIKELWSQAGGHYNSGNQHTWPQYTIDNPEKFVNQETLDGMYDDMLSAFEILDKIQDEDAIKQYLDISAPEDLFLDELVAEVAKPEKTLQEKKADLEKQIKAKKKELTAAKRNAKIRLSNIKSALIGQIMKNQSKWIKH